MIFSFLTPGSSARGAIKTTVGKWDGEVVEVARCGCIWRDRGCTLSGALYWGDEERGRYNFSALTLRNFLGFLPSWWANRRPRTRAKSRSLSGTVQMSRPSAWIEGWLMLAPAILYYAEYRCELYAALSCRFVRFLNWCPVNCTSSHSQGRKCWPLGSP